jgi:hypothetical protein
MSEQITHIAFFDDMAQLLPFHPTIDPDFAKAIEAFPDHGIVATGSRGNHLHAVPLMEKAKNEKNGNVDLRYKLISSSLGWIMHRAIDLVTKPVSLDKHPGLLTHPRFSADEGEVYHDAFSFRETFERGHAETVFSSLPLSPLWLSDGFDKNLLSKYFYVDELEDLLVFGITSEAFGVNYSLGNVKNAEQSLLEFKAGFQEFSENLQTYIDAYHYPSPEKTQLYLEHFKFYDEKEDIIKLLNKARKGRIDSDELVYTLKNGPKESVYSQGLSKAFFMIENASLFFQDKISKDKLHDAIENFHPPHRL